MILTFIDFIGKIQDWIQEHSLIMGLIFLAILVFIFYFLGKAKMKKIKKATEDQKTVDTDPLSGKGFVQGEEVKHQEFNTTETEEKKHE